MRKVKPFLVTLLIIALAAGAYVIIPFYQQGKTTSSQATLYFIQETPTDFNLVPVRRQIEGDPSPTQALQALLEGPLPDEGLFASVPPSARLLGLEINQGKATANFSSEIIHDFPGGSLMEAYLVEAIVNTLTEFPDIAEVQILVDGRVVESIGGHVLILQPLRRKD